MPLTPAHPAAILPLHRVLGRRGPVSALVIGSMGPDFVYYLPFGLHRAASHSLLGLLWFVLPLGLVAYGLFHAVMRRPLEDLLPHGVRARLAAQAPREERWRFARLPLVAVSLVLGGATHDLWDSFTHGGGYFVKHIKALGMRVTEVGQYEIWGYKYLQHGSTLLGLLVLAWWVRSWYRRHPAVELPPDPRGHAVRRWAVLLLVAFAALALGLRAGLAAPDKDGWLQHLQYFAGPAVIAGTSTLVGGLIAYCLLWSATHRHRAACRVPAKNPRSYRDSRSHPPG